LGTNTIIKNKITYNLLKSHLTKKNKNENSKKEIILSLYLKK